MPTETIDIVTREDGSITITRNFEKMGDSAHTASGHVDSLHHSLGLITETLAILGVSLSAEKVIELGDAYINMNNKLRQVTSSAHELEQVNEQLLAIAQQQGQSVDGLGNLYYSFALATKRLHTESSDLIAVTQAVSQTLTNAGRSADQTGSAIKRLAAGMQEGTISGRAITSLFVQFPELAQGIARALGVSEQAFRVLAQNGNISTKSLIEALKVMGVEAANTGATIENTVSKSIQRFTNDLQEMIGKLNEAGGVVKFIEGLLNELTQTLKNDASDIEHLTSVMSNLTAIYQKFGLANAADALATSIFTDKTLAQIAAMNGLAKATEASAKAHDKHAEATKGATKDTEALTQGTNKAAEGIKVIRFGVEQMIPAVKGAGEGITIIRGGIEQFIPTAKKAAGVVGELSEKYDANGKAILSEYEQQLVAEKKMYDFSTATDTASKSVQNFSQDEQKASGETERTAQSVEKSTVPLKDYTTQLKETSTQTGLFGQETKVTTEAIRDQNGNIIPLSRTIEETSAGVNDWITGQKTLTKELIQMDGEVQVVSQSVEKAKFNMEAYAAATRKAAAEADRLAGIVRDASGNIVGSTKDAAAAAQEAAQQSTDSLTKWGQGADRWATEEEIAVRRVIEANAHLVQSNQQVTASWSTGGGYNPLGASPEEISIASTGHTLEYRFPNLRQAKQALGESYPYFASGGSFEVGGPATDHPVTIGARRDEIIDVHTPENAPRNQVPIKVTQNFYTPNVDSFRRSARQIARDQSLTLRRVQNRSSNPV